MKRSPVLDAVLVGALMIGATAMTAFIKGIPEACSQPTPASVESLFAPCLAAERQDRRPPADVAALYFPLRRSGPARRSSRRRHRPATSMRPAR